MLRIYCICSASAEIEKAIMCMRWSCNCVTYLFSFNAWTFVVAGNIVSGQKVPTFSSQSILQISGRDPH